MPRASDPDGGTIKSAQNTPEESSDSDDSDTEFPDLYNNILAKSASLQGLHESDNVNFVENDGSSDTSKNQFLNVLGAGHDTPENSAQVNGGSIADSNSAQSYSISSLASLARAAIIRIIGDTAGNVTNAADQLANTSYQTANPSPHVQQWELINVEIPFPWSSEHTTTPGRSSRQTSDVTSTDLTFSSDDTSRCRGSRLEDASRYSTDKSPSSSADSDFSIENAQVILEERVILHRINELNPASDDSDTPSTSARYRDSVPNEDLNIQRQTQVESKHPLQEEEELRDPRVSQQEQTNQLQRQQRQQEEQQEQQPRQNQQQIPLVPGRRRRLRPTQNQQSLQQRQLQIQQQLLNQTDEPDDEPRPQFGPLLPPPHGVRLRMVIFNPPLFESRPNPQIYPPYGIFPRDVLDDIRNFRDREDFNDQRLQQRQQQQQQRQQQQQQPQQQQPQQQHPQQNGRPQQLLRPQRFDEIEVAAAALAAAENNRHQDQNLPHSPLRQNISDHQVEENGYTSNDEDENGSSGIPSSSHNEQNEDLTTVPSQPDSIDIPSTSTQQQQQNQQAQGTDQSTQTRQLSPETSSLSSRQSLSDIHVSVQRPLFVPPPQRPQIPPPPPPPPPPAPAHHHTAGLRPGQQHLNHPPLPSSPAENARRRSSQQTLRRHYSDSHF